MDESKLGRPLRAIYSYDIGNNNGYYTQAHLIEIVEQCIATLETWGFHGNSDMKRYLFLVMALASVKSRLAGHSSLDMVSEAIKGAVTRYKQLVAATSEDTGLGHKEVVS
jgi:hypothetical protein